MSWSCGSFGLSFSGAPISAGRSMLLSLAVPGMLMCAKCTAFGLSRARCRKSGAGHAPRWGFRMLRQLRAIIVIDLLFLFTFTSIHL